MAAVLWAGPGAAVSHRAAAAIYGLPGCRRGLVEISTVLPRQSNQPWLACHRVRDLGEAHTTLWAGIPVTTADRTLLDLAGLPGTDPDLLERCLDEVLRRGLATRFRIAWTVRHSRLPGRALIRQFLDVRLPGYLPPHGELEATWLRLLKEAGIPPPEREEELAADGYRGRVDFLWPEHLVAVETDGFRWHATRHSWQRELSKRNILASRGYRCMHITWEDVMERPGDTISSLRNLLRIPPQDPHGPPGSTCQ